MRPRAQFPAGSALHGRLALWQQDDPANHASRSR